MVTNSIVYIYACKCMSVYFNISEDILNIHIVTICYKLCSHLVCSIYWKVVEFILYSSTSLNIWYKNMYSLDNKYKSTVYNDDCYLYNNAVITDCPFFVTILLWNIVCFRPFIVIANCSIILWSDSATTCFGNSWNHSICYSQF